MTDQPIPSPFYQEGDRAKFQFLIDAVNELKEKTGMDEVVIFYTLFDRSEESGVASIHNDRYISKEMMAGIEKVLPKYKKWHMEHPDEI
jgi:5,10-methenyltetrahydromethanopterin hydrogenase